MYRCHNKCIVPAQPDARYFALSYMWGGVEQVFLTTENVDDLSQLGSLQHHWSKMPSVIQDAIAFVAALEERYLWVDSLCIVQNDAKEKHHQILQMGAIYNGAVASLVGSSGIDANSGLAGVRPGSRNPETKRPQYEQPYLIDPGPEQYTSLRKPKDNSPYIPLERRVKARQLDLFDRLSRSNYSSRAWTYQERLLSRRCIYFMKNMVYFHCRSAIRGENKATPYSHKTEDIRLLSLFIADPIFTDPLRYQRTLGAVYAVAVAQFTRKKLSFPLDVLDAFSGIGSAMEKFCSWRLIAGMPEGLLDYALLWRPSVSVQRRGQYPNNVFPSWSWSAWHSEADYESIFRQEPGSEPYLADMESLIHELSMHDQRGVCPVNSLVPVNEVIGIQARHSLGKEISGWLTIDSITEWPNNMLLFQAFTVPFKRFSIVDQSRHYKHTNLTFNVTMPGQPAVQRTAVKYQLPWMSLSFFINYAFEEALITNETSDYDIVFLSTTKRAGEEHRMWTSGGKTTYFMLIKWTGGFAERVTVGQFEGTLTERGDAGTLEDNLGMWFVRDGCWKTIRLI